MNNFSGCLLMDLYELTMAQVYFKYRKNTAATFDLFVRRLPANRGYLLACGLSDILEFIKGLKFDNHAINYLKRQRLFSQKFLSYLKNFRFRGDIWAMPEGEIFFANEPLLRITANIIEAQILESFLLNTVNLQTMIASKASRVVQVAGDRPVYDFSLRRTHGQDAGLKAARCAYLAGFKGTSNILGGKFYGIPIVGTMAHSFVMSFESELESFYLYSRCFPNKTTLLVDTYNTKKGIDNAITIGRELKQRGSRLLGIRLDSADLVSLSKFARKKLNSNGLKGVKIFASGSLDEYKIHRLIKRGALIDNFGVGTHMGTSSDIPYLDVIYKLSQIRYDGGRFLPTMKLSKGKVTFPGRKQIFRQRDRFGLFTKDILGLENEKISGRPLLKKIVEEGKIIYKTPSLEKMREFAKKNLSLLAARYKGIYPAFEYPVVVSKGLSELMR
jgi:nicotinate phosphoribosyltransferase